MFYVLLVRLVVLLLLALLPLPLLLP